MLDEMRVFDLVAKNTCGYACMVAKAYAVAQEWKGIAIVNSTSTIVKETTLVAKFLILGFRPYSCPKNARCDYCKKPGHRKDQYYDLIGFPPN